MTRRLCTTLAFLHGEGIVHRDLKPPNVILRPDGVPVLIDFGLMAQLGSLGREMLEVGGKVQGTVGYMSPEQLRGDLGDARSDLYALGCLLYECVVGEKPFRRNVILEALSTGRLPPWPPAPSERVRDVPPMLEDLILGLMTPDPRDRLGHASDAALILAELGAEDWPPPPSPPPRDYLYRPGFVGRSATLAGLAERMRFEQPTMGDLFVVGGESGVGKTRLVMELASVANRAKMRVVTGECVPLATSDNGPRVQGAPLHPFRALLQAIADYCLEHGPLETGRILGPRGKLLAPYEPALVDLPGQGNYPDPVPLPAEAGRFRLLNALGEALTRLCRNQACLASARRPAMGR